MTDIPKNKLTLLKDFLGDIEMPDVSEFIAEQIIDAIENDVEIWPEDCEGGIGFYAAIGDLYRDDSLNTRTKPKLLSDIVDVHYFYDDDSGWERAEKLGLELKALADELLESAARGKARWAKDEQD